MRAVGLSLRPATADDCVLLWQWRNDADVRRASFHQAAVPLEEHRRWLAETLARPDRRLFVAVVEGAPVGSGRLDLGPVEAEVSVTVAPEWRGRGLGRDLVKALVEEGLDRLGLRRLVARVKADNPASRRAFEQAGFRTAGAAAGPVLTLVCERRP